MANFGVNLEEVWHMSSLLPPQQTTSKHSKYEVDVGRNNSDQQQHHQQQQHSYQPTAVVRDDFIPISNPQVPPRRLVETMEVPIPSGGGNINGNGPQGPQGPQPLPDFVIEYQKEIQYLRSLVSALKKELTQKQQKDHAAEKKKQLRDMLIMIGFAILLIIIIVLLSQVIQKMNRIISQPLMFNV